MIVVSLKTLGQYKSVSKNFADAIAWIESGAWKKMADGRFPIDGTRIHGMIMSGETKPPAACFYEAHRRYADIQIVLEGKEYAMVRDLSDMPVKDPYSAEKDIEFFFDGPKAPEHRVALEPGVAGFFFPEDAHKPSMAQGEPAKVRKLVVKVEVA
jgi:YhcH/YjgK/YiaL family protein